MSSRWRTWTIRLLLVFIALAPSVRYKVEAFGGSGPYDHLVITRMAMERFANDTDFEINAVCAVSIMQAAVVSDNADYGLLDTYHCDNNNIVGCSWRLDQLKSEANKAPDMFEAYKKIGMALHIVQDFYSHSNWVEINQISMVRAPLEYYKDFPPPPDLQTGVFPDPLVGNFELGFLCFLTPQSEWGRYIAGATHGCLNKDSRSNPRGSTLVPLGGGADYHRLAAEYAINHSVELLKYFYDRNVFMKLCSVPEALTLGCNQAFVRQIP